MSDFVVCGTEAIPRLAHKRRTLIYPLTSRKMANIVADFTGKDPVSDIAVRHGVSEAALTSFISKLEKEGIVRMVPEQGSGIVIPFHLGPREPWLEEVHIDITDRCNLSGACLHCYRGDLLNKRQQRKLSDWIPLIDQLERLGVHRIAISGGEPFMRKDLADLIRYASEHNILVSGIFTNGTLRNCVVDKVLDVITSRGLETSFYVSLDGPTPETNDVNRGKGSFTKTMRFLKKIGEVARVYPIRLTVNSQVNIHNVHLLLSWYEQLASLHITRWRMNAGRMAGRLLVNNGLVVDDATLMRAYGALMDRHIAEWKSGTSPFRLNIDSFFRTEMLNKQVALTFHEGLSICDYKEHACSIEPSGDVQFCTSWTKRHFGNVFVTGMESIWYGEEMQGLKQMKIKNITDCTDCDLLQYCGGGCRHTAHSITGRDPVACVRYRSFAEHVLPRLMHAGVRFSSE